MKLLKLQKGQAMLEVALVLPLLAVLLLAIGYFGHAVTTQQSLNMGARAMARQTSLESTLNPDYRTNGSFIAKNKVTQEYLKDKVLNNLSGADKERIVISTPDVPSDLKPVGSSLFKDNFVFLYVKKGNLVTTLPLTAFDVNIGVIFYGAKVSYQLKELDNIAKIIGLRQGVTISATSLMPAELPLRGDGYGLLYLNPWISEIVSEDVEASPNYKDFVP